MEALFAEVQMMINQLFEGPQIIYVTLIAGALGAGGLLTLWVAVITVRDRPG